MRWRSKPKYRVCPKNFPGGFVPRPPHFNAFSTHLIYRGHAVGCGTPQNCGPLVKVATLGFLCQSASGCNDALHFAVRKVVLEL